MDPIISAKNLTRVYRSYRKKEGFLGALSSVVKRDWENFTAVDELSFEIRKGELVGFLGPNGAGKTTTLKMLAGILNPTSGQCRVLGFTPHERQREFKKQISLVMGQKSQLIWDLPAADTFLLHRDLYQLEHRYWRAAKDVLIELLDVKRAINIPVRQLSLGERMKCELIVSLLHEPKVLFLDEPTIGLDVISQKHLWEFLRSYQKTNKTTILLTSHYMEDIANLCSRVIVISKGKLAYDGALEKLIKITQPAKDVLIRFAHKFSDIDAEKFRSIIGEFKAIDHFTYAVKVPRAAFAQTMTELFKSLPVEDIQVQEADLSLVMERSFKLGQT